MQILDLALSAQKVLHNVLEFPNDDLDSALITFSPGLELVFIGRLIFQTMVPHAEALSLPLPLLEEADGINEPRFRWTCEFSPCARYFAAVANGQSRIDNPILHVFKLDLQSNSVETCNTEHVVQTEFTRLWVTFHSARLELLLCGCRRDIRKTNEADAAFTILVLVLESAGVEVVPTSYHLPLHNYCKFISSNERRLAMLN